MNAHEKGKQHGFAYALSIIGGSKRHFEEQGRIASMHEYKKPEKREEYLQGWMTNWKDASAPASGDEILTY